MKPTMLMILFFITGIALQTHAMLDKSSNNKESTSNQHLLQSINSLIQSSEIPESASRYQNNITLLPVMTSYNNGLHLSVISSLPIEKKESHERSDEIYEVIPLNDTQKNDIEENFSSKCVRCCIPLTKEKIAKLTKKNRDINLYREDKCKKRKLITACIVVPVIVIVSSLIGIFTWVATIPDCHNSNSSLSPCWDWIW